MEVDFSKILGSFTETSGNNTTPQEKQHTNGERSDSGVRAHSLQDFWGDARKPPTRTRHHRKNVNNKTRFPFLYLDRFMLGGFSRPRSPQDAPRRPKAVQDAPRWAKDAPRGRQDAPRRAQDAPKTSQDTPKMPQDALKTPQHAPKTPPRCPRTFTRRVVGAQTAPKWNQAGTRIHPKSALILKTTKTPKTLKKQ